MTASCRAGSAAKRRQHADGRQHVCGESIDFTANIALSGWAPGKYPANTLPEQLVRQNPRRVLEIIEMLYQFKSATIAAQCVATQKPVRVLPGLALAMDDRELPVSPLPGSVVSEFYLDPPIDETQITVDAPLGSRVVELYAHGGTKLDWNDVQPLLDDDQRAAQAARNLIP